MPHVLSLTDAGATAGATRLSAAGGKGASLARLAQSGRFRVPGGFVVTTEAFRAHTSELQGQIAALDEIDAGDTGGPLAEAAAALREAIEQRALPEDVRRAVEGALPDDAPPENTRYAVRSSATAEDLPAASFAGQHDTFLGVRGAGAMLEKVKACMASLFTERAMAYRARNAVPHSRVAMAVVVQEMAEAQAAGVLFTADPDTGSRRVAALDAVRGLGEALVSGRASADHARIDRRTGALLSYETAEEDGSARVLTGAQVRALARLGAQVEDFFEGVPQDIEWALADEGFAVLQSRPITTLTPPPEPRPTDGRLHVYLSVGHGQAMTDPMPPLALDLWAAIAARMMKDMFGLEAGSSGAGLFARTEGRLYTDLTPFLGLAPMRRSVAAGLGQISEEAAEGAARLFEERSGDLGGGFSLAKGAAVLRALPGALPAGAQFGVSALWGALRPFFEDAEAGAESFRAWLRQWGRDAEAQVLAPPGPKAQAEGAFGGSMFDNSMSEIKSKAMRVFAGPLAGALLGALLPAEEAGRIAAAGRGHAEEVGTRMTLALGDLADAAREAAAVEEAVQEGSSLSEIRNVEGSGPFVRQFEAFLEEFGHRAAGEFDLSRPRWRDDPGEPLGIVRGILRGEEKGAHRRRLQEREREAEEPIRALRQNARRGPLGALRGPLADRLLRVYRAHLPLRDEPKHHAARLFAAWHDAIQRSGRHLAGERAVGHAGDVWYLRSGELFALLDDPNGNAPGDLPDRIEARRAEHERQKRRTVPPLITSEGEAPRSGRSGQELPEGALVGTGVSGGTVVGRARIVHSPGEADLEVGDILVCPASDPAWTPLFATAGGLVTETGGRFTHGALVAREYGLPAVASVPGATQKIRDGQQIRVDGARGVVELLEGGRQQTATDGNA